jgi:hypothetical protein
MWSGQRTKALHIALLAKGYAVLVWWWVGILACRNINNDHSLSLGFPLFQGVVTFPFSFSNSINSLGECFLSPPSGLGGSSDVEVAALELFFLDPATLDFILAVLGLFLCRLRLVVSLTPTEEMASKPSPPPLASFSEGFFLALAYLGMVCRYESSIN